MTSLKILRFLKDKLETPHVVSYFFKRAIAYHPATTEALNISFAITPSDTFVTEPVISIA